MIATATARGNPFRWRATGAYPWLASQLYEYRGREYTLPTLVTILAQARCCVPLPDWRVGRRERSHDFVSPLTPGPPTYCVVMRGRCVWRRSRGRGIPGSTFSPPPRCPPLARSAQCPRCSSCAPAPWRHSCGTRTGARTGGRRAFGFPEAHKDRGGGKHGETTR